MCLWHPLHDAHPPHIRRSFRRSFREIRRHRIRRSFRAIRRHRIRQSLCLFQIAGYIGDGLGESLGFLVDVINGGGYLGELSDERGSKIIGGLGIGGGDDGGLHVSAKAKLSHADLNSGPRSISPSGSRIHFTKVCPETGTSPTYVALERIELPVARYRRRDRISLFFMRHVGGVYCGHLVDVTDPGDT